MNYIARQKQRYWTDLDYRLKRINHSRRRLGLAPLTSIHEAATRGPRDAA